MLHRGRTLALPLALALLTCLATAPPVRADDPAPDSNQAEALARANALNGKVIGLYGKGKYAEAIPLAREALAIRERTLGKDHADVGQSLRNLSMVLKATGSYAEALSLQERALVIREKALGSEDPELGLDLDNLAELHKFQGAYEKAQPLYERALAIMEKALGPDDPSLATSLNNIAVLFWSQGEYAKARPPLERALAIFEGALGPDHPSVASALTNLAMLLKVQGDPGGAGTLCERAVAIFEKALGPDHPRVADGLNGLGSILHMQGSYALARQAFERALAIRTKTFGADHPLVADSLTNLAMVLRSQGALEEARPLYTRALAIVEKAGGKHHRALAPILNNLASLHRVEGEGAEARALLERSLAISEQALGEDHPTIATALGNLAAVFASEGAYAEARTRYDRALAIREKALGKSHPRVATNLGNIGSLLQAQGRSAEAVSFHERALAIYEETLGKDHPHVAAALQNLATVLQAQGLYAEAQPRYRRSLAIVEAHLRTQFAGLSSQQRLGYVTSMRSYLDAWLGFAPLAKISGYPELLRFRGLASRAEAAERVLARRASGEESEIQRELLAAQRLASRLANELPKQFGREARARWQRRYAEATAQRERLALELSRSSAPLRGALERLDLDLSDIQRRLGPRAALVDILRVADRYLAWIVGAKGEAKRIDLGSSKDIEEAAIVLAERVADPGDADWLEAGRALSDLVVAPIREKLGKGVRTIYLCPDAALAAVPFAALPIPKETRLLMDEVLVVNVSMAQDLVPGKAAARPGHGALVLGGVDYGQASESEAVVVAKAPGSLAALQRAPRGKSFGELPGTREEATQLRSLLGEDTAMLLGRDATEARLHAGVAGRRVLHLATHGFVRDDIIRRLARLARDGDWLGAGAERQLASSYDPMVLAALALAGANPRDGGDGHDGILTALEASYLDLDGVDLLVLSACQTALGKAESGEGVIGLVQGFQMAGAKQVIGSLWKVDDEATQALMIRFYESWNSTDGKKGLGAAAALKKAQEYVRTFQKEVVDAEASRKAGRTVTRKSRPWEHPYFWAAWVLWERR